MPSKLRKTVKRETEATVFERSELRNIIISIEPARGGATIGFRLKGHRDTYRIGVGSAYTIAVSNHLAKIERKAKQLHKDEKVAMRSARSRARKSLQEDLR